MKDSHASGPGARLRLALLALLAPGLLLVLPSLAANAAEEEVPSAVEAVAGEPQPNTEGDRPAPDREASRENLKWEIEGYLAQDLRYRQVSGEKDLDLYTHVFGNARYNGETPFLVRVNGRLVADAVGDQQPNDRLRDAWDSFDGDVQFRLYEAYVESGSLIDAPLTLRGGRQFINEGQYFHIDGIRLDYDLDDAVKGLDLSAIFGIPVKWGETSRNESWLAGLIARARVTNRTRLRFEYYHVSERFPGINGVVVDPQQQPVSIPAQDLNDDYFALSLWHRVQQNLHLFARVSLLNGDGNELQLRGRWYTLDGRWTLVLEWYQLFERLNNVTNDLTPFVPMMGVYEPFYRGTIRVTWRPQDVVVIQAGYAHRALEDSTDEGTFNHTYNNYYASGTYLDLMDGRLDLTLVLNGYDSDLNEIMALGGHGTFRLNEEWELFGGVDYSLFKYDYFQNTEREDVWTYTIRALWKIEKDMKLEGTVYVDDDRFDTYITFLVRFTVRW